MPRSGQQKEDFRWAPKIRSSVAWWAVGAAAGAVLYFGNVAYVKATSSLQLTTVRVLTDAEDASFLQNPGFTGELARHGLNVQLTLAGSGEIQNFSPAAFDAFDLGSQFTADEVMSRMNTRGAEQMPFGSSLTVFTWKRLLPMLRANGIVTADQQFDLAKYLEIASTGQRWTDLAGNNGTYPNSSQVLLNMASPQLSLSGALFVAAASYVLNGDKVVTQGKQVASTARKIAPLTAALGLLATTDTAVLEAYLVKGVDTAPMVLGQSYEFTAMQRDGGLPADAVALPLSPMVFSARTIVPFDSEGREFGALLSSDRVLEQLEAKYGFLAPSARPADLPAVVLPTPPVLTALLNAVSAYSLSRRPLASSPATNATQG